MKFFLASSIAVAVSGFATVLTVGDQHATRQTAHREAGREAAAPPTYAEHIAPLLNKHCVECHRPGEVAPFSLMGYENAKKWAPMLEATTADRIMPPWKAEPGYGEFEDENRLTDAQIETIRKWVESGAPRGDRRKEPAEPTFPEGGWSLGKPDAILSATQPFKIPAEGKDIYRNFVIKTDFKETKWVEAMEVKPGNARVVHHVIAFIDERGRSHALDGRENDGQEGYRTFGGVEFIPDGSFGGWAPGLRARRYQKDSAFELKPGATVVLQIHYNPSGKPEEDLTQVGLFFSKNPPKHKIEIAWIANPLIRIPAGKADYTARWTMPILRERTVLGVMPHMHLLGRKMTARAVLPNRTIIPLIKINDWDFNWQLTYIYKKPITLPAGSRIEIEAVYDNSEDNPHNPHRPPKLVTWGEQTGDEMFLLVVPFVNGRIADSE